MTRRSHLALATAATLAACGTPTSFEQLSAVAWTQTAAEHEALCLQTFGNALTAVKAAVLSIDATKPRAVVLDVDETVLDNSPHQAANVLDGKAFAGPAWSAWVAERRAAALPGAVAFTQECVALGVTPIFVTNRTTADEPATRDNLRAAGFPLSDAFDCVLTRGDVDGKSDKTARRAHVTEHFTVLAWLGDDLGDFVLPADTVEARLEQVRDHRARWGTTWFVLPNAMYGSWERALAKQASAPSPAAMQQALRR
ncbi:MAG: HAD family acid phosphatase [Planctomycetota bacterium]